jgi:hypothetical protein
MSAALATCCSLTDSDSMIIGQRSAQLAWTGLSAFTELAKAI